MASVDSKPVISGNETRTEHAKTLIFCGPTPPMADWVRSANLGLEIYPQAWNPGRRYLKTGDTMWFIAVGQTTKPQRLLRDASMQLVREGGTVVAEGVPNHNGGYDFAVPEPGRYMVTTTERRPDPKQPEHWLVDTSSLTFDIR
jgi:Predicted outer membrane protein